MLYQKNKDIMMYEQNNEGIAQMTDGTIHILNVTAYEVYQLCNQSSAESIVSVLSKKYESVDSDSIYKDVVDILKEMLNKNIIVVSIEDNS